MARTHETLNSLFTDIANSIRTKGNTNAKIVADNFPAAINAIDTDPSGDATVTSGTQILAPYTAYAKGVKYTGSMVNQGAVTNTITTQGGTYTIPEGYHDGTGKVTARLNATTLNNSIISGEAYEEATGDYAWKSTVQIPAGYHASQTLEKTFSEIFPAPETPGTASEVLLGYQFYDKSGKVVTGTMPNVGAVSNVISTQGGQYTVPKGYHDGTGTVTANISAGVIASGAGTANVGAPVYNSTSAKFVQTVSGNVAAPTVGTAGYISSTEGTKNPNTVSGSYTLNKIAGSTAITGTLTYAPTLARTAKPSADTWTDAASGAATTTKPTSGVYVQIDAAAKTGRITATPSVTTEGYGTTSYHGITNNAATVGAAKATTAYVPITTTSASVNGKTVSYGTGWITGGSNSVADGALSAASSALSGNSFTPTLTYNSSSTKFDFGGSANATGTAYAKASTSGYVTSANDTSKSLSAAVSATGSVDKVATGATISGTTTAKPSITRQAFTISGVTDAASGAATTTAPTSGVYVKVNSAANTGTLTATPKVTSAGYGTTSYYGSTAANATVGASASADTYVPIKTGSATTPATTKAQSTPSITVSSAGLITASVAATSASVTPTVNAGWVSAGTAGTVTMSASSNTKQLTTQAAKTVTPSTSSQTAVASGVYTTGAVTVAAMPTGTLGTVSASKGTVSNHSISVTPSISAGTAGYNAMAAKSGTAVTVSASELVSGSLTITANDTYDVTNYASVVVSASKPEQSKTATANGTVYPDDGYALSSVVVAIPVYDGSVS